MSAANARGRNPVHRTRTSVVVSVMLLLSASGFSADEMAEPPVSYTLEVDGKPHAIQPDKPLEIAGTLQSPKVVLRVSEYRTFTCAGMTFRYPTSFSWEAEAEEGVTSWILDGNSVVVMVYRFDHVVTAKSFAEEYADSFHQSDGFARIRPIERNFGGALRKGLVVETRILDHRMVSEIYTLQSDKGTRLLMFQDSPPDGEMNSEEGKAFWAEFSKSFNDTASEVNEKSANK